MLAVAPEGSDDDDGEGADTETKWVPGRVLGERSHSGKRQYKISLDGYDSEDDAWVDCDDPRVKPYATAGAGGHGGGGGSTGAEEAKAAAKREQEERDRARKFAEQRKADARTVHSAAAGMLDTGK